MRLTIGEALQAMGGSMTSGSPDGFFHGVSTDTRTLRRGDLFFALKGERFDGHTFLKVALQKGAAGAVVSRSGLGPLRRGPRNLIRVRDTLTALGDLAAAWRGRFRIPVVAVTGSNGKTTTKEMIAAILESRYRVLKTEKNFNNLIGLPQTLFHLTARDEVAVLEMGMNAPGEIERLAEIAAPHVGVITNVGRAHLEGLHSLRGVAAAKGELLRHLPRDGLAILNRDDHFFHFLRKISPAPVASFGWSPASQIRGDLLRWDDLCGMKLTARIRKAPVAVYLRFLGRHNASNALAALAVGNYFKVPAPLMRRALERLGPQPSRMEAHRTRRWIILNDTYNANPDSMLQAFHLLREVKGSRRGVAVMGEMLELGRASLRAHREIGARAVAEGVDLVVSVGRQGDQVRMGARQAGASTDQAIWFRTMETAARRLPLLLRRGDLILVKGSRGVRMERIVEELKRVA